MVILGGTLSLDATPEEIEAENTAIVREVLPRFRVGAG
jgi:hypothetical protein